MKKHSFSILLILIGVLTHANAGHAQESQAADSSASDEGQETYHVIRPHTPDILSNSIFSFLSPTTCYGDHKPGSACYDSQRDYDAVKQSEVHTQQVLQGRLQAQAQPPTAEHKKLLSNYYRCLYRSFGQGSVGKPAFQECLKPGITLCNGDGMATSSHYEVSSITGRVALDNRQCGMALENYYNFAEKSFADEFESYSRSEEVGAPYQPFMLDIRKYVGANAQ